MCLYNVVVINNTNNFTGEDYTTHSYLCLILSLSLIRSACISIPYNPLYSACLILLPKNTFLKHTFIVSGMLVGGGMLLCEVRISRFLPVFNPSLLRVIFPPFPFRLHSNDILFNCLLKFIHHILR